MSNLETIQNLNAVEMTHFLTDFKICNCCSNQGKCSAEKLWTGEMACREGVNQWLLAEPKAKKLVEHTHGIHIYMKLQMDVNRIEEIDVYLKDNGKQYITSADPKPDIEEKQKKVQQKLREEIIRAFEDLC